MTEEDQFLTYLNGYIEHTDEKLNDLELYHESQTNYFVKEALENVKKAYLIHISKKEK